MADGFLRPRFIAKKRKLSFRELARFQGLTIKEVNRVLDLAVAAMRSDLEKSTPDVNDEIIATDAVKAAEPLTQLLLTLDARDFHSLRTNTPSFRQIAIQKEINKVDERLQKSEGLSTVRLKDIRRGFIRTQKLIDNEWGELRKAFDDGCGAIQNHLGLGFGIEGLWSSLKKEINDGRGLS